jgi:hypothetical protein
MLRLEFVYRYFEVWSVGEGKMWCVNWERRAILRESKDGLSSEKARITRASRKNLDGAIWAGIRANDLSAARLWWGFGSRWVDV